MEEKNQDKEFDIYTTIEEDKMRFFKLMNMLINDLITDINLEQKCLNSNYILIDKVKFNNKEELIDFICDFNGCEVKFLCKNINRLTGKNLGGYCATKKKNLDDLFMFVEIYHNIDIKIIKEQDCKNNSKIIHKGELNDNELLKKYKQHCSNAKQRGFRNYLTFQDYKKICLKPCYECGVDFSGGVDREKSHTGYEKKNCQPCCSFCNSLKSSFPDDAFHSQILRISLYQDSKN